MDFKKNDDQEIVDVVAADTILTAVIESRVADKGNADKSFNVNNSKEDVPVPDYIGMAGEALKKLFARGVEKAGKWLPKAKNTMNRGIYTTVKAGKTVGVAAKNVRDEVVETAQDVAQAIKEAPDKIKTGIDSKIQEVQMAHARNVFTFRSKKSDLFKALQTRINDLKEKGLDSLARNLEISKAYALCGLDKARDAKFKAQLKTEEIKGKVGQGIGKAKGAIKEGAYIIGSKASKMYENAKFAKFSMQLTKGKIIKGAKGFAEKVRDKAGKTIDHYGIQAALVTSKYKGKARNLREAMQQRFNQGRENAKKTVRKTAKGVVYTGVKGMAVALGSATKVADKIHTGLENRTQTLNQILQTSDEMVNNQHSAQEAGDGR